MNTRVVFSLLIGFAVLTACASPTATPPTPTQALLVVPTFIGTDAFAPLTPPAGSTPIPGVTSAPQSTTNDLCTDPQVTGLIDWLKTSMLTSDGVLLASLVSPTNGMAVRYFRNGKEVNYSHEQAKFLFETTFEVDWGAEPGSGLAKVGAFHDVIVPKMVESFNQAYTLHCNELKHGGATYDVMWPYEKGFYSIYFSGTQPNGNMDWHTWVVGIEYINSKPYIYAVTQYFWEP